MHAPRLRRPNITDILITTAGIATITAWAIPASWWVFIAGGQLLLPWVLTALGVVAAIGLVTTKLTRVWPISCAVTVLICGLIAPIWDIPKQRPTDCEDGNAVNVLAANTKQSFASPADLAAAVQAENADIVSFSESTQEFADELARLLPTHPHHIGESDPAGFAGTFLYSKWPLTDAGTVAASYGVFAQPRAIVHTSGGDLRATAVHVPPPIMTEQDWAEGLTDTAEWAAAGGDLTSIAFGDFNANLAHKEFGSLMRDGFHDRDQTLPWRLSWGPRVGAPYVAKLDHVLVRNGHLTNEYAYRLDHSDHAIVGGTVCTQRM